MNQTDSLTIIISAIYKSLGSNEQKNVIAEINKKLLELNKDTKTHFQNGAAQVADLAEKITGINHKSGNGFD